MSKLYKIASFTVDVEAKPPTVTVELRNLHTGNCYTHQKPIVGTGSRQILSVVKIAHDVAAMEHGKSPDGWIML